MQIKEDLIGYDFQGWPIFKQTLKEFLIQLGGIIEDNKIIFNVDNPFLSQYPLIMEDDGMGYGINNSYIQGASCFKSVDGNRYINIFIQKQPTESYKKVLLDKWNEDQEELQNILKEFEYNENCR